MTSRALPPLHALLALALSAGVCTPVGASTSAPNTCSAPAHPAPHTTQNEKSLPPPPQVAAPAAPDDPPCIPADAVGHAADTAPATAAVTPAAKAAAKRQENQRTFAAMLLPFARMAPQAQVRESRRQHLSSEQRAHCNMLDARLPALERRAHDTSTTDPDVHSQRLKQARHLYRALGC